MTSEAFAEAVLHAAEHLLKAFDGRVALDPPLVAHARDDALHVRRHQRGVVDEGAVHPGEEGVDRLVVPLVPVARQDVVVEDVDKDPGVPAVGGKEAGFGAQEDRVRVGERVDAAVLGDRFVQRGVTGTQCLAANEVRREAADPPGGRRRGQVQMRQEVHALQLTGSGCSCCDSASAMR